MLAFALRFDPGIAQPDEGSREAARPRRGVRLDKSDNLAGAFLAVAAEQGSHPAIVTKTGVVSYQGLRTAALHVQAHLRAQPDYRAGAVVAFQFTNSLEYLAAFYGCLLADCVAAPLPSALEPARMQKLIALCDPAFMICGAAADTHERHASVETLKLPKADVSDLAPPKLRRRASDLAMLMFTSGSTGTPKAVMLSHANLLANARSILHELPIGADDRALAVLPFCHAFGNSVLQTHILAGATLILGEASIFPQSVVASLDAFNATSFSATPEVYEMLVSYGRLGERRLNALRYAVVAGGPIRPDLADDVAGRIAPATFYIMYGQSEATARLTSMPSTDLAGRRGTVGKPIQGVELAVVDDGGRVLPAGQVGMLCARGDNVMLGYWRDEAETAEVLNRDGWLRTGDLAYRDEDGYVYLQGRANLLVKIHGYRVHPAEIEQVVQQRCPDILAVAVPMVRQNETRFALFVAARNGSPVDMANIRAICQRELLSYKVPLHYQILDELPLTSGQKIDRAALLCLVPRDGGQSGSAATAKV